MGDRISMSISVDKSLNETLNRGSQALLLRRQYEFPFWINVVSFSYSFSVLGFISLVSAHCPWAVFQKRSKTEAFTQLPNGAGSLD